LKDSARRSIGELIFSSLRDLVPPVQKARVQKIFWIYFTNNYSVNALADFRDVGPAVECHFIPMTRQNYDRVLDFRTVDRVLQYHEKLGHGELGFFAEHGGRMVGSIWATINKADRSKVVRKYMKLQPNQAIIHDAVASELMRGMRIGPYMVGNILKTLILELGISKVVWDVHFMNRASMRMLEKLGLRLESRVVSVCAADRLILQLRFGVRNPSSSRSNP
jgi:RimJ/RimL family protein N-acetyltransferase